MARDFFFNQYLTVSYPVMMALPRAPVITTPLTLSCWFNSDNFAVTGQVMVFLGSIGVSADGWWIGLNSDGTLAALTTSGNLATHAEANASPWTTGMWHHGCGVFESATSRLAYLNGGTPGTNTASVTPAAAITGISIGVVHNASPLAFMDGRIAEVGLWNAALTPAEVASLARGVSPLLVRPQNLAAYWPLIGRHAPDLELIQGLSVNVINSPTVAPHTRVIYPASGVISNHESPPGQIAPPLLTNAFQVFAPTVTVGGTLAAPFVSNPFTLFAPTVSLTGEQSLDAPLVDSSFTVYAPASVHVQESTIQEDSRELEPHNLRVRIVDFVAGDDLRISRLYTELAQGITISKAYLTIKRLAKDDDDNEAIIQKTINASMAMSGEIVDNDTTGGSIQLYFDLSSTDTALLTPLIPYNYDVQVHTIGNAVYTCEKGVIVMQQGVTAATS